MTWNKPIKRHKVKVVYMSSGYNWCRECGKDVRPRGDNWVHSSYPFDSFYARGT